MSLKLIVKKIERMNKKIIENNEIKDYCKRLSLDYNVCVKYLLRNKYIARIFRGIFYVYSIEERKLNKSDMDFYDIIKEALKVKKIKKWYFGLETALKFNNLTHEYFTITYIINDKLFRSKPIIIMGRKVKFHKLVPKMFSFGIIKKKLNYSDPEKTVLDLFYLKHINKEEFKEIKEKLSKNKLKIYSKNYNQKVIENLKK